MQFLSPQAGLQMCAHKGSCACLQRVDAQHLHTYTGIHKSAFLFRCSSFGCDRKQCLLYKLPWLLAASPPFFYLKVETVWDQTPDPRYLLLLEQCKVLPRCSVFGSGACSPTTHSSHTGTEFLDLPVTLKSEIRLFCEVRTS